MAERPKARAPRRVAALIAVAAVCAGATSLILPWVRGGLGGDPRLYTGLQMPGAAVVLIVLSAGALVCIAMSIASRRAVWLEVAAVASGLATGLAAMMIVLVEWASALLPNALLPATLRRYALDLRAGPGVWLALGAFALAASVLGRPATRSWRAASIRRSVTQGPNAAALAALVGITVAVGVLRYESWVTAAAAGSRYGISGWLLPFVGPISLAAVVGLAMAVAAAAGGRTRLAGMVAAAAGWLVTLAASLTIVATGALAQVPLAGVAPTLARQYAPRFVAGELVWVAFALGVLAAIAGAVLIFRTVPTQKESIRV